MSATSPPGTLKPGKIKKVLLGIAQLSLGYLLVYLFIGPSMATDLAGIDNFRLANLPVTPLSSVERLAGTGEIVRLHGKITIDPPLTGANGAPLAFKAVTQTDDGHYSHLDDEWWKPTVIFVTSGQSKVRVEIKKTAPDYGFLTARTRGRIRNGQIPAEAAAWLGRDFEALKPIGGDTVRVYTIAQHAPVTLYGVVERSADGPVLVRPLRRVLGKTGGRLILSTLPDDALAKKLRFEGYMAIFLWFALALPVLIVTVVVLLAQRKAKGPKQTGTESGGSGTSGAWTNGKRPW